MLEKERRVGGAVLSVLRPPERVLQEQPVMLARIEGRNRCISSLAHEGEARVDHILLNLTRPVEEGGGVNRWETCNPRNLPSSLYSWYGRARHV